ncbi:MULTISPECIES: FxsA family protein [unclassified Nocardiopsis]|uniref:FxsA family protein n=1 Tax=unclassified Nocardiopsis TaxID=2649073 RepID=UPI0013579348|nr:MULTISPECIES: FxsA family protein [unclassified Nocardiopsis]
MPLLIVLALMALPFLEVWLMIEVGGWIGVPWTLAVLVSMLVLGVAVLRRAGTRAFRDADAAMRSGEPPRGGLLDPLMLMAGGVLLIVPGFVTAALGLLMVLPFTRPVLRWAFAGWAQRRVRRMRERADGEFTVRGATVPGQGAPGWDGRPGPGNPAPGGGRVIQGSFEPEVPRRDRD